MMEHKDVRVRFRFTNEDSKKQLQDHLDLLDLYYKEKNLNGKGNGFFKILSVPPDLQTDLWYKGNEFFKCHIRAINENGAHIITSFKTDALPSTKVIIGIGGSNLITCICETIKASDFKPNEKVKDHLNKLKSIKPPLFSEDVYLDTLIYEKEMVRRIKCL